MKTAIQELENKLKDNLQWIVMNADYELMEKLFKESLEKEKEQIIAAGNFLPHDEQNEIKTPEEYYNQTYNQDIL